MGVALPPPLPPQPAALVELRAEAARLPGLVIDYQGVHLRVFGSALVPEQRLRRNVAAAANLSDAVRSIGYSYYLGGYPATVVDYAVDQAGAITVYVKVVPGRISQITGAAELRPYFADLLRRAPLSDAQLEADRAAADTVSTRAGLQYKPAFRRAGGDAVALDLGQSGPGPARTSAAASFNNYGNRYAGPYLANLGLRQSFSSGDEFTLTGTSAIHALGLGGSHAAPYHGADGGWSHAGRDGEVSLTARYADFQELAGGLSFNGRLEEFALGGQTALYADFRQRLSLSGRLLHDHEALAAPAQTMALGCNLLGSLLAQLGLATCEAVLAGGDAFSENYNSIELALAYRWRTVESVPALDIQAGLLARKGLSPGQAPGSNADLSYQLWQPSFALRFGLTPHWALLAGGTAQFSGGVLPQQQQFVIGGPTSLHAYLAGAGVGDRGASGSLALEWKGERDSLSERLGLRPRVFVEYASATHRSTTLGEPPGTVSLADAGMALDLQPLPQFGASLSVGRPFLEHGAINSPDQLQTRLVFFQLAAKF